MSWAQGKDVRTDVQDTLHASWDACWLLAPSEGVRKRPRSVGCLALVAGVSLLLAVSIAGAGDRFEWDAKADFDRGTEIERLFGEPIQLDGPGRADVSMESTDWRVTINGPSLEAEVERLLRTVVIVGRCSQEYATDHRTSYNSGDFDPVRGFDGESCRTI